MEQNEKNVFFEKFNNSLHTLGRFTLILGVILLVAVPFVFGLMTDALPDGAAFLSGILKVGIIYYPVALAEFLIYAPMLGNGGSYLAFITGNVTNLKIPCAMNAMDIVGTKPGTPENEIVSTLSIATSSLVTMLVLFVGVLALVPLTPVLQNPILVPAFDNIVAALFGALGLKYFVKSPKIAVIPLVLMSALCIFVPSMISQTSVLLLPAGALALVIGFVLFKKNKL